MHNLHSASVSPELKEYVRAYAQREVREHGQVLIQPVPASLENVLEFEFHDPPRIDYCNGTSMPAYPISLVGPNTFRRADIRLAGHVESFGIFFQPFGLWQLFRLPLRELPDKAYDARDVLGRQIQQLWMGMAESVSFEDRVKVAERHLLRFAARASGRTAIGNTALHMFRNPAKNRVAELASDNGLSVRQFERRFVNEVGIPPKLFSRITRFQTALDAKVRMPNRSWLAIAHKCGYHDQMHLVRDFRDLSGDVPTSTFAQLGDIRPPALAASELDAARGSSALGSACNTDFSRRSTSSAVTVG